MIIILPKLETRSRGTMARYTLRVFKREESDQSGAMPREARHARRQKRRGSGGGELGRRGSGQGPRHERGCEEGQVVLVCRRSDGRGQRLGVGGGRSDAAIHLRAITARAVGLGREEREGRWGRRHRLKPEEGQTQEDGGCPFHVITLPQVGPDRLTGGGPSRITFCPVCRRWPAS